MWTVAATGQTCSQGASSQCMQGTGWTTTSGLPEGSPEKYRSRRIQCISRPFATWALPTTGMLFSLWQATTHALHPMHEFRSMVIPHWWP